MVRHSAGLSLGGGIPPSEGCQTALPGRVRYRILNACIASVITGAGHLPSKHPFRCQRRQKSRCVATPRVSSLHLLYHSRRTEFDWQTTSLRPQVSFLPATQVLVWETTRQARLQQQMQQQQQQFFEETESKTADRHVHVPLDFLGVRDAPPLRVNGRHS